VEEIEEVLILTSRRERDRLSLLQGGGNEKIVDSLLKGGNIKEKSIHPSIGRK